MQLVSFARRHYLYNAGNFYSYKSHRIGSWIRFTEFPINFSMLLRLIDGAAHSSALKRLLNPSSTVKRQGSSSKKYFQQLNA